uniref:Uncharacterized protein n=1 Tax=viral metagenome TaxID=1070528 RepID=A0A6C0C7X8_9ZZZZ
MQPVMDTKIFSIFISLLWGFGIALLFKKACDNGRCIVVKIPNNFADTIVQNDKCYQLNRYLSECTY